MTKSIRMDGSLSPEISARPKPPKSKGKKKAKSNAKESPKRDESEPTPSATIDGTEKTNLMTEEEPEVEKEKLKSKKKAKSNAKKSPKRDESDPTPSATIDGTAKTNLMTEEDPEAENEKLIEKKKEMEKLESDTTTSTRHECMHPKDTYSFFVVSRYGWLSQPFWLAICVSSVQIMFFSMVTYDSLLAAADSNFNHLNLPVNVSTQVRVVQAVAIFITIFLQNDLRISLERWHESYEDLKNGQNFPDSTAFKWYISLALRFLTSLLGLTAIMILILQSDNVFDLTLNFTGLGFVSELDDIAFLLAEDGFFGNTLKESAEQVKNKPYRAAGTENWCIRVTLWLVIAIGLYTWYGVVVYRQEVGIVTCPGYYVTFDDPVIPSMETFTGMYVQRGFGANRRPIYFQPVTDVDGRRKNLIFGHNGEEWVFGIYNHPDINDAHPWGKDFFTIANGDFVNGFKSYDIRDTNSEPWTLGHSEPTVDNRNGWEWEVYYNPANLKQDINFECLYVLNVEEIAPATLKCKQLCDKTCMEITMSDESSSFPDDEQRKRARVYRKLIGGDGVVTSHDHPVFVGRHSNVTDRTIDLILVAGSRWVLTDSSKLYGLNEALAAAYPNDLIAGEISPGEIDALVHFFTNGIERVDKISRYDQDVPFGGFHALQLSKTDSIAYLSDPVEPSFEAPMYPFSDLHWYPADYPPKENEEYLPEKYMDKYDWFPGVDPTQVSDIAFECSKEYEE